MSYPRVLVASCRELLTREPRTPYGQDRPRELGRTRRFAWWGVAGLLVSAGVWALWAYLVRDVFWQMLDLTVYHDAARSVRDGDGDLYTTSFGKWPLPFIYPPVAAYAFKLLLFLGLGGLKWFMLVTSMIALAGAVWASWSMLGYRHGAGRLGAIALTFAAVLWFEPVTWTLMWDQINLILLAALMIDLSRPDGVRWKGVGIGLAAGIKLTPAIFVVYLVMTRRFRAAGTALATFAVTVAAGAVLLPGASREYWANVVEISGRVDDKISVGTLNNQSVMGLLSRLTTNEALVTGVWLLLCAALALLVMVAAAKASLRGHELVGVVLTGSLSLFVSPISWSHHWVWVVPALVLLVHVALVTRRRRWWAASAGFLVFYGAWPMSVDALGHWNDRVPLQPFGLIWWVPRDADREQHWNVWQFFVGNSYVLVGLALLVALSHWVVRGGLDRIPGPAGAVPAAVPGPARARADAEDVGVGA